MKQLAKIAAAAAFVVLGSQAQAAMIFNGDYNNALSNNYIGSYISTSSDSAFFSNANLTRGSFTNTYVFNFSPVGSATVNGNFIPGFPNTNSISNFQISLFSATASGGCTPVIGTAIAGFCTGLTLGPLLGSGFNLGNSSSVPFTPLTAGLYAFTVRGNVESLPTLYSGQLSTTPVPEPTSLALAGLGLLGLAAAARKRKAA